ncbi:NAD(P)/FAD-dependent oxidoreductase [Aquibacillus albus]|uniref:D-amino-acid dehydrogenase n=1 Tax=Aquibacillus albus TaxID=1168171 RepID=A0ABS2MZA5_9BACI|nr:FAD-binding oxidoreductase [Aquibacillus albus]MBM7571207.1 D-amino-acid dehydrogenase [Aquibacillus albus]
MSKIVVIGAGILGASAAYQLAKSGVEVVMVDQFHEGQATDAAAGIVCPWLSQRRNQAWYQLAKSGAKFYPELINALEKDGEINTGYKQVGAISIRKDNNKLDAMEERVKRRREHAPEIGTITRLNQEETKAVFPPLDEGFSSIHISGAARVNGRALRNALQRAAVNLGAERIHGKAELLTDNENVNRIKVGKTLIEADKIIVTAGVWAKEILKPLGVNFLVEAQKAQIAHLKLPGVDTSTWPVVMPPSDQYLLAFDDSRIIAGATHEDEIGLDFRVTPGGLLEIFEKALKIAPELADSTLFETRVGFRPVTPGFLPVIGPLPNFPNILVANGLGSSGLTTGPYLGFQLAKLALNQEVEINLEDYPIKGAIG